MEEYEENDGDNYPEFQDEVMAYQRAGPIGKLQELLSKTTNLEPNKKEIISQEDRYLIDIQHISKQQLKMSDQEVNNILTLTQKMTHTKYKNAGATVIGYIILNKNSSSDEFIITDMFQEIFNTEIFGSEISDLKKINPEKKKTYKEILTKYGVEKEDAIRYARYLSKFL